MIYQAIGGEKFKIKPHITTVEMKCAHKQVELFSGSVGNIRSMKAKIMLQGNVNNEYRLIRSVLLITRLNIRLVRNFEVFETDPGLSHIPFVMR